MKLIAAVLVLFFTLPVLADDRDPGGSAQAALCASPAQAASAHTSAGGGASHSPSGVLLRCPLKDVPGKEMVVVALELPARGSRPPRPHRHPGSVYVYVTRGTARLALEGGPVQEVPTGGSFFEPPGALHTVAESASETESASAIAVMIVPKGAALATVEPAHHE